MNFTREVKLATDPIYQKISKVMPEIEWSVHAPYIHEINQLKNMPKNLLNLNFNEESWVEIYSADPSDYFQVVYKLFYENETYQLKVESPLVVVVGNASGVVGTFNDLPLDFSANANRLDVSVIRLSNG